MQVTSAFAVAVQADPVVSEVGFYVGHCTSTAVAVARVDICHEGNQLIILRHGREMVDA
jgi:hypothetical protein